MVPFIQQFIKAFSENHNDVELVIYSLYIPNGKPYFWNNIKVVPLNGKRNNLLSKLFFILKAIFIINRDIRKMQIDGILSFWYTETSLIAKIISFMYSKKCYIWLQGQDVKKSNPYIKFFRPNPKSLIALSSHQNNILYNELGFKAKTINSIAVNPSFFPLLNTERREIDILGAGSLIPLKNYQLFLDSVLKIKQQYDTIKIVLIGNGPLHSNFIDFIKKNKLQNNITLPGLLSHKETLAYMNNSKIFLHTSNFEGGGMVLYEALYSGCQVISTIPIENNSLPNFYYCTSKKEIINTIHKMIDNQPTIKRSSHKDIENTTKTIYNLFFPLDASE